MKLVDEKLYVHCQFVEHLERSCYGRSERSGRGSDVFGMGCTSVSQKILDFIVVDLDLVDRSAFSSPFRSLSFLLNSVLLKIELRCMFTLTCTVVYSPDITYRSEVSLTHNTVVHCV